MTRSGDEELGLAGQNMQTLECVDKDDTTGSNNEDDNQVRVINDTMVMTW